MASQLYATPLVLLYPDFHDLNPIAINAILLLSLAILWLLLIAIALRKAKKPLRTVWRFTAFPRAILGPLLLSIVGIMIVNLKLRDVIYQVVGGQGVLQAPQDLALHVAVSIIMAPLFEELLHRGIILDSFLKRYSTGKAILLSSLLFTIGHASWIASPGFFLTGIFLGYWYFLTRSLWVCIAAHALVNLLGHHLSCVLCGLDPSATFPQYVEHGKPSGWIAILGIAALVAGIYFGEKQMKSSKERRDVEGSLDG